MTDIKNTYITTEIPRCIKCGSSQIRTTKEFKICIRCGYRCKLI